MKFWPSTRRARTIAVVGLAVALVLGAGVFAWARTQAVPAVVLTTVTRGTLATSITGVADIEARDRSVISLSPVTRVADVLVVEGQQVVRGDILVVLDADELQSQLEAQQIGLSDAEATLAYLAGASASGNAATSREGVAEASVALEGAKAALQAANSSRSAVRAAGQTAVGQAEIVLGNAQRASDAASANVATVGTLGDNRVRGAELALDNAEAADRLAGANLATLERQLSSGVITRAQYEAQRPALAAALTNAENAVAAAEVDLDGAKTVAAADLATAEAAMADADAAVRSAELALSDARSRADADLTAADAAVADAARAVRSAEIRLTGARGAASVSGSTDAERVSNQTSQVALIRAQIRYLEEQIEQTHLRATVDGVVTEVDAVADAYPQAGDVVVVDGTTELVARLPVDQADSVEVRAGRRATVSPRGLDQTYEGVVAEIAPRAEVPATSTDQDPQVEITVTIDDPDDGLRVGYEADVEIILDQRDDALQVPREAVQTDANTGREYLLTVDAGGRVSRTFVDTGVVTGTAVEILGGAVEGQRCVADPDPSMAEGARVREA